MKNPIPTLTHFYHLAKQSHQHGSKIFLSRPFVHTKLDLILNYWQHPKFNSQSISNLWSALAYLPYQWQKDYSFRHKRKLFAATIAHVEKITTPKDTSNLIKSMASTHITWAEISKNLQTKIMTLAKQHTPQFNAQDITTTLCGLWHLGITLSDIDNNLYSQMITAIERTAGSFNPQDISNTLGGLAHLGACFYTLTDECCAGLALAIKNNFSHFSPQEMTNTLWACAVLGADSHLFSLEQRHSLIANIELGIKENYFHSKGIRQLEAARIYYQLPLKSQTINKMQEILRHDQVPTSSGTHKIISTYLRELSECKQENEFYIAGRFADIAFPKKKIIIEIDGPHHYDAHQNLRPLDCFNEKLAAMCGYQIFRINCQEWMALQLPEEKTQFLKTFLEEAGIPLKSIKKSVWGYSANQSFFGSHTARKRSETTVPASPAKRVKL